MATAMLVVSGIAIAPVSAAEPKVVPQAPKATPIAATSSPSQPSSAPVNLHPRRPSPTATAPAATTAPATAAAQGAVPAQSAETPSERVTPSLLPRNRTGDSRPGFFTRVGQASVGTVRTLAEGGAAGETHYETRWNGNSSVEAWSVIDGWDLGQYIFHSGGPVSFDIEIGKYLGPVDAAYHPAPGHALFGKSVMVVIHASDVDTRCPQPCQGEFTPERDEVVLNGQPIGVLDGFGDATSETTFAIPASALRFRASVNDAHGGLNVFEVNVDLLNGWDRWAVTIDDARLELPQTPESYRPTVLLHGLFGEPSAMDGFKLQFTAGGVDQSVILQPGYVSKPVTEDLDQVEDEINSFIDSTGWDRVNLVGHSLGGLVARAYAATYPDRVKQVLMLGTPNGGIEPIDRTCLAGYLLFGILNPCDSLQPVLTDLTRDAVQNRTNKRYPDQDGIRYLAMAGDDNDGEGGCPTVIGPFDFNEPNDGCVAQSSVEYLWILNPNGGKEDIRGLPFHLSHDRLRLREFEAVPEVDCILYHGCPWPGLIAGGGEGAAVQALAMAAPRTAPAGGAVDVALALEGTSAAVVTVLVPGSEVSATIGGSAMASSTTVFGTTLTMSMTNPGNPSIHIANAGGTTAQVQVIVQLVTDRHLTVSPAASWVRQGQPIAVSFTLDQAAANDTLVARLVDPGGVETPITLTPTGTGHWTATVTPPTAGTNRIVASFTGTRPRYTTAMIDVASAGNAIGSGFGAALDDANGDGLAEGLTITPTITVQAAGAYAVLARLVDGSGTEVGAATATASLVVGSQPVSLRFDGRRIFESGSAGPFHLVDVRLFDERGDTSLMQDVEADLGATPAFLNSAFQHERITFDQGLFSSQAIESDGDSIYDRLDMTGTATVEEDGTYVATAGLYAADGSPITVAHANVEFLAGSNSFVLSFPGSEIAAAGHDGPWHVRGLVVAAPGNAYSSGLTEALTTATYLASQFQPPAPAPTSQASSPASTADPGIRVAVSATFPSYMGEVELWRRFQPQGGSTFSAWGMVGTDPYGNFWASLDQGLGRYEFYSVAIDDASGVREAAPPTADSATDLVAGLGSSVRQLPTYSTSRSLAIPYVANYPSGSGSVELWQRFKANCNCSPGPWTLVAMATASPVAVTVAADGQYEFHTIAIDGSTGAREAAPLDQYAQVTNDSLTNVDTSFPTSTASSLPATSASTPITVTFSENDAASIELWSRYRANPSDLWGAWELWQTHDRWTDFLFEFPHGAGYYEFHTVATDWAGNRESAPTTGDAATRFLPVLGSAIGSIPPLTTVPTVTIPYTYGFTSGSGTVELWQRFKAAGASTFGTWEMVAPSDRSPISLSLTSGDGVYEFYTVAVDATGPREGAPATADATTLLDTTAPTSSIRALPPVTTTFPITLHCDASDAGSGVQFVQLLYRVMESPSSPRPPWSIGQLCLPDGTFPFDFPYGAGYYEFASSATDDAGLVEGPVLNADTGTQFDPAPISSVQALPPTIRQTSVYPSVTSTLPYEMWERFRAAGSSQFEAWTLVGYGAPGGAPVTVPLAQGDGRYELYSIAYSATQREDPPASADTFIVLDMTPTVSSAGPVVPRTTVPAISVPFTASDGSGTGVTTVALVVRFRLSTSDPWGSWQTVTSGTTSPFSITLGQGQGYYEFATRGSDVAGNTESLPTVGDATTHYTTSTAPSSVVGVLPLWSTTSNVAIPFTADFASGSGTTELWRRFQAADSSTWSAWTLVTSGTTSPFAITLPSGDGRYEFYTIAIDPTYGREGAPVAADAFTDLDGAAPASSLSLPSATRSAVLTSTYSTSDGVGSGVATVEIWSRFQADGSSTWGPWALFDTPTASPWDLWLTSLGRYEFYTIAVDTAGNREAAPASADASTVYDVTRPSSSASALPGFVNTTSVNVPYTAGDGTGSGVASVELWRRFRAAGSSTWSSWALSVSGTTSPISAPLTSGNGRYEFYTIAVDAAGNRETAASSADAFTVLDSVAPVSAASALPASVTNATLTVPYTSSDTNGSGVASVELWQRFQASGSSTWTAWTNIGTRTSSPFSASLASGNGRYEFYTIGIDAATNREAAPAAFDAFTVLTAVPVTSANALATPVRSTAASIGYTASGATSVELWRRFRAAGSPTWSSWALVTTVTTSPISTTLPSGNGRYEFYTIGISGSTREAAPVAADAWTVLDTAQPTSTVGTVPSTTSGASASIPFTAADDTNGTGIAGVELWSRYRANDTVSGGTWTLVTTGTGTSGTLALPFASGLGIYDVATIAIDAAGNREGGLTTPSNPKSLIRAVGWGSAVKVNTDTGTALQDKAACVIGGDGTTYCAWEDSRSGNSDVYFAQRSPSTGAWSGEVKVNTDTGTKAQNTPAIAVDSSGNVYVVWADERNTTGTANTDVYFAKRTGTSWGANTKLNTDATTSVQSLPRIAVGTNGVAVAVWLDLRSSQKNIYAGRLPAGSSTWTANMKVTSDTAATKGRPDVAVGSDGTGYAVWEDARTSGNADVWFASLAPATTTWSTNAKVSDDTTTGAESWPHIGLTTANMPIVSWVDARVTAKQVRTSQRPSSSWNASVQASDSAARPSSLTAAAKGDGGVVLAWDDTRVATIAIWGVQCEAGTSGVTRCAVSEKWSDLAGAAQHPALAVSSTTVALAWRDDTAGGGDIRFRVRAPS